MKEAGFATKASSGMWPHGDASGAFSFFENQRLANAAKVAANCSVAPRLRAAPSALLRAPRETRSGWKRAARGARKGRLSFVYPAFSKSAVRSARRACTDFVSPSAQSGINPRPAKPYAAPLALEYRKPAISSWQLAVSKNKHSRDDSRKASCETWHATSLPVILLCFSVPLCVLCG